MTKTVHKYSLNQRHQLIDLNQDNTNFVLTFEVVTKNKDGPTEEEFEALVITQEQLDAIPNLNSLIMKKTKGRIGGNMTSDDNNYQNHFLVLKADKPVEVEVNIDIQKIEPSIKNGATTIEEDKQYKEEYAKTPSLVAQSETSQKMAGDKPFYRKYWFWIVVGVIIIACLTYYAYLYKPEFLPSFMKPVLSSTPTVTNPTPAAITDELHIAPLIDAESTKASLSNQTVAEVSPPVETISNEAPPKKKKNAASTKMFNLYDQLNEIA